MQISDLARMQIRGMFKGLSDLSSAMLHLRRLSTLDRRFHVSLPIFIAINFDHP